MDKERMLVNGCTFIGALCMIAGLIGAIVPGLCFHVYFATDESTIDGHKQMAARVEARIAKKDGHDS